MPNSDEHRSGGEGVRKEPSRSNDLGHSRIAHPTTRPTGGVWSLPDAIRLGTLLGERGRV